MIYLLSFINWVLGLIEVVIFIVAIMSWLIAFNVINVYNSGVRSIWDALNAITEPMLRPIRRYLPMMGGIDISPLILLVAIEFIRQVVIPNLMRVAIG